MPSSVIAFKAMGAASITSRRSLASNNLSGLACRAARSVLRDGGLNPGSHLDRLVDQVGIVGELEYDAHQPNQVSERGRCHFFCELGAELLEILRSQIGHQTVASELVQNPFADSKVIVEHALRQIVCVESDFLRCQEAIRQFPHGHAAGVGGCRPWDSTGLQIVLHVQILPARRFGVRPSPEVVEFAFDFLRPLPLACGNKGKSV